MSVVRGREVTVQAAVFEGVDEVQRVVRDVFSRA
jgi:hypothetical protein